MFQISPTFGESSCSFKIALPTGCQCSRGIISFTENGWRISCQARNVTTWLKIPYQYWMMWYKDNLRHNALSLDFGMWSKIKCSDNIELFQYFGTLGSDIHQTIDTIRNQLMIITTYTTLTGHIGKQIALLYILCHRSLAIHQYL